MPAQYPLPVFHFSVQWGGTRIGFSKVTGLTQENQAIEYRDGSFPEYSSIKMPGLRKFSNVTLKRGIVKSDNDFFKWLSTIKLNTVERRDLTISLLNETHEPVMVWKIHNAFPVKVEGPQLKASGNEVAIESIELAHEGLEQPHRHPFMPVLVARDQPAGQPVLEGLARLAQIVQQRRQRSQQVNVLPGVPVVLVVRTQHVAGGRPRRHGALRVEAAGIADDPQQLAVVQAADPVTGHRRVAACRLAQQASQRVQTVLRDRCLPGPVAAPLGELVEDATGFHQRALVALRDQQDVHQDAVEEGSGTRACAPRRKATALSVSIMKSSDSLRVRVSMQAWRNSCSVSPRLAEMKA